LLRQVRRDVVLSLQNAIGIRLRDVIVRDDMGQHDVGLGLPARRVDVSSIAEILAGVPDDEQRTYSGPRSGDRRRQHRPHVQF
jgi:hypothetical protein